MGALEPEWGFTSLRLLPNSCGAGENVCPDGGSFVLYIKVREIGEEVSSKLCFGQIGKDGNERSAHVCEQLPGSVKYEGLWVFDDNKI